MVRIRLKQLEIRFRQRALFPPLAQTFETGGFYALTGSNGSGKTTLMRVIAGQKRPDSGEIEWEIQGKPADSENWYASLSWSGPYLDYPAELTLGGLMEQHFWFRRPIENLTRTEILKLIQLGGQEDKRLRNFSSGMLQRLKSGLAILTDSPVLLIDEPTANLDQGNRDLVLNLLHSYRENRLVILASNIPEEYQGADQVIALARP